MYVTLSKLISLAGTCCCFTILPPCKSSIQFTLGLLAMGHKVMLWLIWNCTDPIHIWQHTTYIVQIWLCFYSLCMNKGLHVSLYIFLLKWTFLLNNLLHIFQVCSKQVEEVGKLLQNKFFLSDIFKFFFRHIKSNYMRKGVNFASDVNTKSSCYMLLFSLPLLLYF